MSSRFLLYYFIPNGRRRRRRRRRCRCHRRVLVFFLFIFLFLLLLRIVPPSSFVASYFYLLINHEKKWPRWGRDIAHATVSHWPSVRSLCNNCEWPQIEEKEEQDGRHCLCREGRKATEKKAARLFVCVVVCSFSSTKAAKTYTVTLQ